MPDVILVGPGQGEAVGRAILRVEREEITVLEYSLEADSTPGDPHLHRNHVDAFFVLEGELEFQVDGRTLSAPAGSMVVAPPGAVHDFPRPVGGPARFLNLHTPGGFHVYLRELARLRAAGNKPDAEFLARHDVFAPP